MNKSARWPAALLAVLLSASFCAGSALEEWDWFEKGVRDAALSQKEAAACFRVVHEHLKNYCTNILFSPDKGWVFPVEGYSSLSLKHESFRKGYFFFDWRKSSGHSAYDIFVRDRNQDCLDDQTGKPVNILAPVDLLVVSTYSNWRKSSGLQGGNYVWAYDPLQDRLFYFAHLGRILVKPGDLLRPGDVIATLARSGKNAAPRRSDTHLHFMVLKIRDDTVKAVDYYPELCAALSLVR